ncbi:MAG: hypothetical protein LBD34_02915 [Puniceicoccales bacterium]|jgi:hypothetical protein|nr:hypothetical protein [Puniceicoccales bacterium]
MRKKIDIKERIFKLFSMEISTDNIHPSHREEPSSAATMGKRIRANNAAKLLSTPKTGILPQKIENFLTETSEFNAKVYSHMLSDKTVTLDKVPMNVFASQSFIVKCLDQHPEELIAHMNSWSQEQMSDFIEKYDVLPEAMLGQLFSKGLKPDFISKNIKLSLPFLRVSANANPHKLVVEILNKEDIQSVRLALRDLDDERVKELWNNGMPTAKLPMKKSSNDEFVSRIRAADPERFEKEVKGRPVNAMLRSKIRQHSLIERSVSV